MSEEKCPQCGAQYVHTDIPAYDVTWVCTRCLELERQIAALEAQVKELEAERVALIKWVRTMIPSGKVLWKALCYDGRGR